MTAIIRLKATIWGAVLAAALASAGGARAMPFFNGFETDIAGWDVFGGSFNAVRVPSGTGGITSATGAFHGLAGAAATNWGGYTSAFPGGGYSTSVKIYLDKDAGWANDTRFDWTSAINNPSGSHRRDFAFNVGFYNDGTLGGSGNRFIVSGGNNTGRSNSFPANTGHDPFSVSAEGWYEFRHVFSDIAGVLSVMLELYDPTSMLVHSWTLSDPTDLIGVTVGGNRYGWLASNEFAGGLAIDDSRLDVAAAVAEPHGLAAIGLGLLGLLALRRRDGAAATPAATA